MGLDEMQYDQMRHQAMGEPAGQAIFSLLPAGRAQKCWDVYKALTGAEYRYHRVVLGQSLFPKTAKVEFMPERLEAFAEDPPEDARTEDEKHRDIVNARQRWKGYEMHLSAKGRKAIYDAFRGLVAPMKDGKPTECGIVLVSALQFLVNVVDKRS